MNRSVFLAISLAASAMAGSTLQNGGFEDELKSWNIWGGASSSVAHSGKKSVKVTGTTPVSWVGVDQVVDVPAGVAKVKVSGWIKSDSIKQGAKAWELGRIAVEFHDAKNELVGGYPPVVGERLGTQDWAKIEHVYDLPKGATSVKLQCAVGNTTGSIYCDDIAVEFLK